MRELVIQKILNDKIIAIVRGVYGDAVLNLVEALYKGGISLVEIAFKQDKPESFPDTAKTIKAINDNFSGNVFVGAGTVLTTEQTDMAYEAGAKYIISPNTDANVIHKTRNLGLVSIPGAMTPTEIVFAHNCGADFVKVFPSSELGTGYFKSVFSPISHIKLLAVGGINEKNARSFIDAGVTGLGIGGNLVNKNYIASGDFDKITELAMTYVKTIR